MNQINQINKTNQINQTDQMNRRILWLSATVRVFSAVAILPTSSGIHSFEWINH
jgi:hypothetical protein